MIKVEVIAVRVPTETGMFQETTMIEPFSYLTPCRIDTVTPVTKPEAHQVDVRARSVIRYLCSQYGYRLFYVADEAAVIARARRREMQGEDSDSPDYGDM